MAAELQKNAASLGEIKKREIKRLQQKLHYQKKNTLAKADEITKTRDKLFELQFPGVSVRTKQKLREEGERPSKLLVNLEKSQQKHKTITEIRKSDGSLTNEPGDILQSLKTYYQNLFTKTELCQTSQNYVLPHINKSLSADENQILNERLTKQELKTTLDRFENGKSPGYNGLPAEFYKFFRQNLEDDFEELANHILFTEKQTAPSMRKSIISLIPKQCDLTDQKNWCPISLLGADYKIITKALALRLSKVMGKIIEPNQTCSIPGRNIFSN